MREGNVARLCPFGTCDGTGWIDGPDNVARSCECRQRRVAKARARGVESVIPPKYRGVSFDRPPITDLSSAAVDAIRAYVGDLSENLRVGRGIWLMGDVGTGKTTLAMLVSRLALEAGHTVAIYSLPRLLTLLRDSYADDAQYRLSELIDRLSAVDLLHVDDVGAEQITPLVLEQLYTIVNSRYEEDRAILLTTNLVTLEGDQALRDQIGDRTVSRLYEICGDPKTMFGEDRRLETTYTLPEPAAEPAYGEPRPRRYAS
jgi:DNA replication protein DnaC